MIKEEIVFAYATKAQAEYIAREMIDGPGIIQAIYIGVIGEHSIPSGWLVVPKRRDGDVCDQ